MSARQAVAASARLHAVRGAIVTLGEPSGVRGGPSKRVRADALAVVRAALREPLVRAALTHFTMRELACGLRAPAPPRTADPDRTVCPLSWTELTAEILFCTARAAEDAVRAARPGVNNLGLAADSMSVLRSIVSLALEHSGPDALHDVVLGYVNHAATWLSDSKRAPLMDDAWQCLQELVESSALRARLSPAYISFWVNACYQQLAEIGPLFRRSVAASNAARRVFVLLATEAPTSDALLRKSTIALDAAHTSTAGRETMAEFVGKRRRPSTREATPVYALILHRACMLLDVAKYRPLAQQRETEATALAVLAACMSEHCFQLYMSRAADAILVRGAPAAASCWTERRHRPHALAFARRLVRIVSCEAGSSNGIDLIRERVRADFAARSDMVGRVNASAQREPEDDLVQVASFLFSTADVLSSLEGLESTDPALAVISSASAWLRVLHVQMARRDDEAVRSCLRAAYVISSLFERIGGDGRILACECATWACRVLSLVVTFAASCPSGNMRVPHSGVAVNDPSQDVERAVDVMASRDDGCAPSGTRKAGVSSEARVMGNDEVGEGQPHRSPANRDSLPRALWRDVYNCLAWQLMRGRNVVSRVAFRSERLSGSRVSLISVMETSVLNAMSQVLSCELVSDADVGLLSMSSSHRSADCFWDLAVFEMDASQPQLAMAALHFMRVHASVLGYPDECSVSKRVRLLHALSGLCRHKADLAAGDVLGEAASLAGVVASGVSSSSSRAWRAVSGACVLSRCLELVNNPEGSHDCEAVWDAFAALYIRTKENSGEEAVSHASTFHGVRLCLERVLFPSGGGWAEDFFVGAGVRTGVLRGSKARGDDGRRRTRTLFAGPESLDEYVVSGLLASLNDVDDSHAKAKDVSTGDGVADPASADFSQQRRLKKLRAIRRRQGEEGLSREQNWSRARRADNEDVPASEDDLRETRSFAEVSEFDAANLESYLLTADDEFLRYATACRSTNSASAYVRAVAFLSQYLLEVLESGRLSFSLEPGARRCLLTGPKKVVRLLMFCIKRLSLSAGLLMSSSVLCLLPHALASCMHIFAAVSKLKSSEFSESTIASDLHGLREIISQAIVRDLVSNVLDALERMLKSSSERTIVAVKRATSPVSVSSCPRSGALGKKRPSRSSAGGNAGRLSKRRRTRDGAAGLRTRGHDDMESSQDEDEDEGFWTDEGSDGFNGYSGERSDKASSQSDEEVWEASGKLKDGDQGDSRGRVDCEDDTRKFSLLCCCLDAVQRLSQTTADEIAERISEQLDICATLSQSLSPDSHEKDMIASEQICGNFLLTRACLWEVLLATGSVNGSDIMAKDLLDVSQKWTGLCSLRRELTESYEEEFSFEKRSSVASSVFLERMRAVLLLYCSRYLEACLGIGVNSRPPGTPSDSRRKLVHGVLQFVDGMDDRFSPRLHRCAKLMLLRFKCAAVEAVLQPLCSDEVTVSTYAERTIGIAARLRSKLVAFVVDADPRIQLASAGVLPSILRCQNVTADACADDFIVRTISKIGSSFRSVLLDGADSLEPDVGEEAGLSVLERRAPNRRDDVHDVEKLADDGSAFVACFSAVGDLCRRFVAVCAMGEIGAASAADRASVVYQICAWSFRCELSEEIAFGSLVRLACRAGYRDPSSLFDAHKRTILAKWVLWTSKMRIAVKSFPIRLVLRGDRLRDGGAYDWLLENAGELVPMIICSDDANTLRLTTQLANDLDMDLPSLLDTYATSVFRVFPMMFSSAKSSQGSKLWDRLWDVTPKKGSESILSCTARNKHTDVLCNILMSVSPGCTTRRPLVSSIIDKDQHPGFVRDCSGALPPTYDPWICLLAVNHIASGVQGAEQTIPIMESGSLCGSIFARGNEMDGVNFESFSSYAKKRPLILAKALASIYQGLLGPPYPPSVEDRKRSFLALGMLYLASKETLLSDTFLRLSLCDVILAGFCFPETAMDARWLLQEVSEAFIKMQDCQVSLMRQSMWFELRRNEATSSLEEFLDCGSRRANRWWEMLELFVPGLISIGSSSGDSCLVEFARHAVRDILGAAKAQGAEVAIAMLDPLPGGKSFKAERALREVCYARLVEDRGVSDERLLEYQLWRFVCSRGMFRKDDPSSLSRLRSLRELLEARREVLVCMLSSECAESRNQPESLVRDLVNRAFSFLVSMFDMSAASESSDCSLKRSLPQSGLFVEQSLVRRRHESNTSMCGQVDDEAVRCLSVLGGILSTCQLDRQSCESDLGAHPATDSVFIAINSLARELRSCSPVARQSAVQTLPTLLSTEDGADVLKRARALRDELRLFILSNKLKQARDFSRVDPVTGLCASSCLPDIRKKLSWRFESYGSALSNEALSCWLRTLAASLASCSENPALQSLEALCFASMPFSTALFPTLLYEVVLCRRNDEYFIQSLSRSLLDGVLENREAPLEALRLVVQCLDRLCEIGLRDIRENGIPKSFYAQKRASLGCQKNLYILDVPYLCAAQAANRAGLFFSALRYSALHIDREGVDRERRLRCDSSSWTQPLVEDVASHRQEARISVALVVSHALKSIGETDGQRAVSQSMGYLQRAAVLSSVESDWPRVLGSCDALKRSRASSLESGSVQDGDSAGGEGLAYFSFSRHRDIVRALLGMGAKNTVVQCWPGLSGSISRALGSSEMRPRFFLEESEVEAGKDLVELRYQAAWKLSEWDCPDVSAFQRVLFPNFSRRGLALPGIGLHEALYISLKALQRGHAADALSCISDARVEIASGLAKSFGARIGKITNLDEAIDALALTEEVYAAASLLESRHMQAWQFGTSSSGVGSLLGSETVRSEGHGARHSVHVEDVKSGAKESLNVIRDAEEDMGGICQREAFFRDASHVDVIVEELADLWTRRQSVSTRAPVPRRAGFEQSSEGLLSLRLALARSLGATRCVVRLSADLAILILGKTNDTGSWARAASALDVADASSVDSCDVVDRVSWQLARARLCWASGEDGHSKQSALRAVKDIVRSDLGGSLYLVPSEPSPSSQYCRFDCKWGNTESGETSEAISALRAEACGLVASWSASLREEEPIALFRGYLELGISAFPPGSSSCGKCSAHYSMAEFANAQMVSIDTYRKTKEYAFRSRNVEKMAGTIRTLEAKLSHGRLKPEQKKSMQRFLSELQKNLGREHEKLQAMTALYKEWQVLAAKHYAACLRAGDEHDLRAGFRLISLWIEGAENCPSMNEILVPVEASQDPRRLVVNVPVHKVLPLASQIASRLGKSSCVQYSRTLSVLLTKMTASHISHCIWLLVALSNLTRPVPAGLMRKKTGLYVGDQDKKAAADSVIAAVRVLKPRAVEQTLLLSQYYLAVSEIPKESRRTFPQRGLPCIDNLDSVVVPSSILPLFGCDDSRDLLPHVVGFEKTAKVLNGLSTPMLIRCRGSDGKVYPQIVKYEDDMRQDAVMEQLFTVLNEVLRVTPSAAARRLRIRTYRVVPVSPFAGVMQFVSNTEALREYLVGSTDAGFKFSAHGRLRPQDVSQTYILNAYKRLPRFERGPQLKLMREVWPRFQPVFRYFFLERFSDAAEWHMRQLAYTRSTAVMSIVGWMVGLGDRHLSNILVDQKTAELVHIDFGVAFETGKLLPTPELMPFRLTRDVVDGMGIDGVEGVFRSSCEVTMRLLRENKDLILMVVEVLLHDPLCNWALEPFSAIQEAGRGRTGRTEDEYDLTQDDDDRDEQKGFIEEFEAAAPDVGRGVRNVNDEAQQVLSVMSEKLDGLEGTDRLSVEAHVARLVDIARSFEVIASAYIGWACYV